MFGWKSCWTQARFLNSFRPAEAMLLEPELFAGERRVLESLFSVVQNTHASLFWKLLQLYTSLSSSMWIEMKQNTPSCSTTPSAWVWRGHSTISQHRWNVWLLILVRFPWHHLVCINSTAVTEFSESIRVRVRALGKAPPLDSSLLVTAKLLLHWWQLFCILARQSALETLRAIKQVCRRSWLANSVNKMPQNMNIHLLAKLSDIATSFSLSSNTILPLHPCRAELTNSKKFALISKDSIS